MANKIHDVGWAAGFFEGEGYIGFNYSLNKIYNRTYPRLVLSVSQVYREPLDKLKEVLIVGSVRGPYGPYSTTRQAYYQYQTSGDKAVLAIELMLPYLLAKGDQARKAMELYKEYQID